MLDNRPWLFNLKSYASRVVIGCSIFLAPGIFYIWLLFVYFSLWFCHYKFKVTFKNSLWTYLGLNLLVLGWVSFIFILILMIVFILKVSICRYRIIPLMPICRYCIGLLTPICRYCIGLLTPICQYCIGLLTAICQYPYTYGWSPLSSYGWSPGIFLEKDL